MNKWIGEFKKFISSSEVIDYYQDEITSLGTDNYEEICKKIGSPEDIAKIEIQNTKKLDYKKLFSQEHIKKTIFTMLPLVILFIYTFISLIWYFIYDFNTIGMYINIKHPLLLNKIFMLTANIILKFSISYIIFLIIERQIHSINDIKYQYNKKLTLIFIIVGLISLAFMINFGFNNEHFDKLHKVNMNNIYHHRKLYRK